MNYLVDLLLDFVLILCNIFWCGAGYMDVEERINARATNEDQVALSKECL